jgi:lipoic acid synthetase
MQLRYSTVTGVARDDLPDEGAWLYAETIREIHRQSPGTGVEILVPDFSGNPSTSPRCSPHGPRCSHTTSRPCRRIFKRIRPAFRYERSLDVITQGRDAGPHHEVEPHPRHGRGAPRSRRPSTTCTTPGTDIITITQYLRPSPRHLPSTAGCGPRSSSSSSRRPSRSGFLGVLAGPLVRSSYRAGRLWAQSMHAKGRELLRALTSLPTRRSGLRRRAVG